MLLTYDSISHGKMNTWTFVELFTANFIGCIGGSLSGPPSSALIPETIPPHQRGTMVAITSWFDTVVNIGGNVVGYMVGEGYILSRSPPCCIALYSCLPVVSLRAL